MSTLGEGLLMTGGDKKVFGSTLYNLRWEEYHKIVLDSFWNLLNTEALVDCTLVCSPLESLPVHRLVLSANSPYFRSLLEAHSSHPHPIIILHDVKIHILRMIVTFIYRGSVTVSSDEMPLLLKTAESLQILGLSQTIQARQTPAASSTSVLQPVITTTTTTPVYSKKARILEQQSSNLYNNSNSNNNNTQIQQPEQLSPLALRKDCVPMSISAPTTPGTHYHQSDYNHRQDYQQQELHFSSHVNSPVGSSDMKVNHLNHCSSSGGGPGDGEDDSREDDDDLNQDELHETEDEELNSNHHDEMANSPPSHSGMITTSPLHLRYSCPYCSSSNFPSQSTLSRHIMLLHPSVYTALYNEKEEEMKLAPPPSSAASVSAPPSSAASSTNSGSSAASSIVCKFCGKPFTEVSQLIQHLPIHTGERPFKCEFCGKAFKLRHHMKDHARVHTGERPFRCSLCGKTFSRSTILKAHEKTHFPKNSSNEQVSPNGNFKL